MKKQNQTREISGPLQIKENTFHSTFFLISKSLLFSPYQKIKSLLFSPYQKIENSCWSFLLRYKAITNTPLIILNWLYSPAAFHNAIKQTSIKQKHKRTSWHISFHPFSRAAHFRNCLQELFIEPETACFGMSSVLNLAKGNQGKYTFNKNKIHSPVLVIYPILQVTNNQALQYMQSAFGQTRTQSDELLMLLKKPPRHS